MLPGDREEIIQIVEHDAGVRTHVDVENVWSRFTLRPNPFAQLYTRTPHRGRRMAFVYLEARRATVVGARLARSLPPGARAAGSRRPSRHGGGSPPRSGHIVVDVSRRTLAMLEPNRRRTSHV